MSSSRSARSFTGRRSLLREQRGDAGEEPRLALLAAEAAAHAPALDDDVVGVDVERVRDLVLHLAGMLRRAVDQHRAVFLRHRVRDHPFEIELLLAADADAPRSRCGAAAIAAARIAALHPLGRQHERLRAHGGLRGQDRLQVLVLDDREPRGAARLVDGARGDGEDRLADDTGRASSRRSDRRRSPDRSRSCPGTSFAVSTATTPGAARTFARSIDLMRACARSLKPIAACSVPRTSGMSSV